MSVHFHLLDVRRLRRCAEGSRWEIGNRVLYDLCEKYPTHTTEDEIIAKIWLIGRSYAAAIERRRNSDEFEGDDFYAEVVGPRMRAAHIDNWLKPLKRIEQPTLENCAPVLSAHKRLTDLFREMTGIEKRSLASKYLHFISGICSISTIRERRMRW